MGVVRGVACFNPLLSSVTNVRLSSADDSRIADSFASHSLEINRLALNNFLSRLSDVSGELRDKRIRTVDSNEVYDLLCKKASVSFLLLHCTCIPLHFLFLLSSFLLPPLPPSLLSPSPPPSPPFPPPPPPVIIVSVL